MLQPNYEAGVRIAHLLATAYHTRAHHVTDGSAHSTTQHYAHTPAVNAALEGSKCPT